MENQQQQQEEMADQLYNYAANQLFNEEKKPHEVKNDLIAQGLDTQSAIAIVDNLTAQMSDAKKSQGKKDMMWGAVWCVGGLIGTLSDTGFIFWGAIIFGGIQFFRGLIAMGD